MAMKPGKSIPTEGVLCALKLPCCRCLDGSATEIKIDTGVAPWRVTTPLSPYEQAAVPVTSIPSSWTTQLAPAIWVGPPGEPGDAGEHEYELQFYVPDCMIPAQIYVIGRAAADDRATIYLDGNPNPVATVPGYQNGDVTPFTAGPVTGAGIHRLRLAVTNDGGPTGIVVRAAITVRCPEELERSPGDVSAPMPGGNHS